MAKLNRELTGRQGDVYFIKSLIPKEAKQIKVRPFALGEVTGHSHRVAVEDAAGIEMYEMENRTFMRVTAEGSVRIIHEDHDPTGSVSILPSGWEGEITIAREYTPEEIRSVID